MESNKVYPINAIEDNEETASEEEIVNKENEENQVYEIKLKDEKDENTQSQENAEAVENKEDLNHTIEINNEEQDEESSNDTNQGKISIDRNSNQ